MNDFDKRLSESLKTVSSALREERQERLPRARAELWRRWRRRRVTRFAPLVAVATVVVLVAVYTATRGGELFRGGRPVPTAPAAPAGTYIGVSSRPVGVSVGNGVVWVASASGWLNEVDPETERSIAKISVGGHPSDIAVTDDLAWYSDSGDGTVRRVSTATGHFVGAPVNVGSLGHIDVDIGPKGTVWVAGPDTGTLYAIDATTGDVVNQKFVDGAAELGIGPGALWVLANDGAALVRIDFATGEEALRIPLGAEPKTDLAVTSQAVYVARADGLVTVYDAATGGELGQVRTTGANPELAVGKGALWMASDTGEGHAELARLDPGDLRPLGASQKFLGTPTDIALGVGAVWITDSSRDALVRLDVER